MRHLRKPVIRGMLAVWACAAASSLPTKVISAADSSYAGVILADGPLAYFRLGDKGPFLADLSGHGNSGIASGSVAFGAAGALVGDSNAAVSLSGGSIKTDVIQTGVRQYTLEAWVKTAADSPDTLTIFSASRPGLDKGFALFVGPVWPSALAGNVTFAMADNKTVFIGVHSIRVVNDGKWHHVVGVFDRRKTAEAVVDPNAFSIYIDGVAEAANVAAYFDCCGTLTPLSGDPAGSLIGGFADPSLNFVGGIDEAAIYNRALPAARVLAHYAAGTGLTSANQCKNGGWEAFGFKNQGACVEYVERLK